MKYAIQDDNAKTIAEFENNSDNNAVAHFNDMIANDTLDKTVKMYVWNKGNTSQQENWKLIYTWVPNPDAVSIKYYISVGKEGQGSPADYYFTAVDDGQAMGEFDDYMVDNYPDGTWSGSLHRLDKEGNTTIRQYYGKTDNPPAGSSEGTSQNVDNLVPGEQLSGGQVTTTDPGKDIPDKTPEVDYLGSALFIVGLGILGFILYYIYKHRASFTEVASKVMMAPVTVIEKVKEAA